MDSVQLPIVTAGGPLQRSLIKGILDTDMEETYVVGTGHGRAWRNALHCSKRPVRIGQEQSIDRSVPLREDGRRFAPIKARMTALAIEGDKALSPVTKSPQPAGVVVPELDCVVESGK